MLDYPLFMQYAPIALFTYSRTDHTRETVESLLLNKEAAKSDLYIFSDGPKNESKAQAVKENRDYIHSLKTANDNVNENEKHLFKSITIVEREKNWGLANSLIAGITDVINKYGRVIVVEDDLIVSPFFLQFMNEALEKYKDDDRVGTISAFVPPVKGKLPESFFLQYFQCWGWATWKRAWDLLEINSKPLLRGLRFKKRKFDVGGGVGNYGNLYCQKVGLVDSWYIRFYASLFLKGKLSLYPGHSLTANNGLDGSGTHCGKGMEDTFHTIPYNDVVLLNDIAVEENKDVYKMFSSYFLSKQGKHTMMGDYVCFKGFIRRLFCIDCF